MTQRSMESQRSNRRDFFKTTSALAAAGALAGRVPMSRAAQAAPSEKLGESRRLTDLEQNVEALGFRANGSGGDNPSLRRTNIPFIFPKFGCRGLAELRRKFDFAGVIKDEDQFADLIALAKWVRDHINRKGRAANVADPIEILEVSATKQAAFFCSHFATVLPACAAAVGLPIRTIGIDSRLDKDDDHENTMHGTCDAYSTKFRKWFMLDAMHGMYYLKDGIPLNAYELACEWRDSQGTNVRIMNFEGQEIAKSGKHVVRGQHESSAYHFFYAPLMMDPFPDCGGGQAERMVFFEDEERRKHIWYHGNATPKRPSGGYSGAFMITDRLDDFYFDLNLIHVDTRAIPRRKALGVSFQTLTPNLAHFSYQIDGGPWQQFSGRRPWKVEEARFYRTDAEVRADAQKRGENVPSIVPADAGEIQQNEVLWKIHKGSNTFVVKPVNRFGREGGVSRLEIEVA